MTIWLGEQQPKTNADKITKPTTFKVKSIDKITNFNPQPDTLEIDTDSFDIDSSATSRVAKTKKRSRRSLPSKTMTSSMTRRKVGCISMRMAQIKALVMVASLPSLKALLI